MSAPPVVSVFMTVYNGERYLRETIESVQAQTLTEWELIVVDDGSTDHTPAILADIAATDSRIKVINRGRLGRAPALNVAWRATRAEYVANIDADDRMAPERLEKQINLLKAHPDIGLVTTDSLFVAFGYDDSVSEYVQRIPTDSKQFKQLLMRTNPISHSSVMMPRHVLETLGGYNESYKVAIDYELWARIAINYELANIPEPLTETRLHSRRYFLTKIKLRQRIAANIAVRWFLWRNNPTGVSGLWYAVGDPIIMNTRYEISQNIRLFARRIRQQEGRRSGNS